MKLSELKSLIREVLKEEIAYHKADIIPIGDDLYDLQIERREESSWETLKTFPTFELAKTEMIRMTNSPDPVHYRVIGRNTKKVYDEKEVLK